jgi:hypothetical protein
MRMLLSEPSQDGPPDIVIQRGEDTLRTPGTLSKITAKMTVISGASEALESFEHVDHHPLMIDPKPELSAFYPVGNTDRLQPPMPPLEETRES